MGRKSKINIFNVSTPEQLNEALKSNKSTLRYYKRLIAMKLIELGYSLKKTSEILQVGYRTVNRWAKTCEESGLEGLKPNFNGGRKTKFPQEERIKFKNRILEENNVTIKGAQNILRKEFSLDFSSTYVSKILEELGFTVNHDQNLKKNQKTLRKS